jgi:hypothetical protein
MDHPYLRSFTARIVACELGYIFVDPHRDRAYQVILKCKAEAECFLYHCIKTRSGIDEGIYFSWNDMKMMAEDDKYRIVFNTKGKSYDIYLNKKCFDRGFGTYVEAKHFIGFLTKYPDEDIESVSKKWFLEYSGDFNGFTGELCEFDYKDVPLVE